MTLPLALTLAMTLVPLRARAAAIDAAPRRVMPFRELQYGPELTRARMQALLQAFVDRGHMSAFRWLGDEDDFSHGHILYVDGSERAVAILYHTQEEARQHEGGPPDDPYRYVDRRARNWLQWLDGSGRIENALPLERTTYPVGRQPDAQWLDSRRSCFTVGPDMIDPALLGGEVAFQHEWFFMRFDCAAAPQPLPPDSNLVDVTLPTGERVCLSFQKAILLKPPF